MNNENPKLLIYQGIIQYLLDSTNYTLKNIADLSSCPIKILRSIYCDNAMPNNFPSEIQLIKLYQMILEIQGQESSSLHVCLFPKTFSNFVPKENSDKHKKIRA